MTPGGCPEVFSLRSREVALRCDGDGAVTWADGRARRLLGAAPGVSLLSLVPPGVEPRARQLLAAARAAEVDGWELPLVVAGAPATLSFDAWTEGAEVALLGSLVPERFGRALAGVGAAMSEVAELHRQARQQHDELERRHRELLRLTRELGESDRGVVALHAELDAQAESLHRVTESRARVVANVSHEFRTPVNSILGLTQLLLSRVDGDLTDEQARQVGFIRRSAEALSSLANDLLDLSRIESGRASVRPNRFTAADFFGSLRGMLRPLAVSPDVELVFEEPPADLALETDEGKLAQILRNLVSNALKFTERGEVRVRASRGPGDAVAFSVADTGIGIAPEHREAVFEEFTQLENHLQARHKGTGLGLPLSRQLAEMLGGELTLASSPGAGSTFTVTVPRVHADVVELAAMTARASHLDATRAPILLVEDDRQTLFLYEKYLEGSGFQVVPVRTVDDARRALERMRPAAVVLDVMLEGETTWAFLAELKGNPSTRDIPALIVTVTDREQKARALGADEFMVKPLDREWLLRKLGALSQRGAVERLLVVDDDEVARYLVRKLLAGLPFEVLEASSGEEGVRKARALAPQAIILDFALPGMSAFEVLDELKKDPLTRGIPVIINTSQHLSADERARLRAETAAILSKQSLSREVAIARIREALVTAGVRPGARE